MIHSSKGEPQNRGHSSLNLTYANCWVGLGQFRVREKNEGSINIVWLFLKSLSIDAIIGNDSISMFSHGLSYFLGLALSLNNRASGFH